MKVMNFKRIILSVFLLLVLVLAAIPAFAQMEDGEDVNKMNTPREGAEAPEKVYARYVTAVHKGDLKIIKTLVYSKSLLIWDRNGREMLAMTKNTVPKNPQLISEKKKKEFQYNYTILSMKGVSPQGHPVMGEVEMIVESGEWKVYQEIWRPATR